MDWLQPMDEYCERLDASFWSEPLNALSNLSFIVAGLVLLLRARSLGDRTGQLLAVNVLAVGIGSFLYHTLAVRWAMLADVVPITAFILFYLAVALRRFLKLNAWVVSGTVLLFLAGSYIVVPLLEPLLGATAGYVPALLAIVGVSFASGPASPFIARSLIAAGLVFAISMTFRALDMPVCDADPYGTHMVWHLLNGLVLYMLVSLALKVSGAPAAR